MGTTTSVEADPWDLKKKAVNSYEDVFGQQISREGFGLVISGDTLFFAQMIFWKVY